MPDPSIEAQLTHISIHAPREGGDGNYPSRLRAYSISIHAPREGGDLRTADGVSPPVGFQSTPPARGATSTTCSSLRRTDISIHAPREGGDLALFEVRPERAISIHAPREGGDGGVDRGEV